MRGFDHCAASGPAVTYFTAAPEKSGYGCAVSAYATYTLPARSTAAGSNEADTVLSPASAARWLVHDPTLPSAELATQMRVSPTTFASGVPVNDAPQPPAGEVRVPYTA